MNLDVDDVESDGSLMMGMQSVEDLDYNKVYLDEGGMGGML